MTAAQCPFRDEDNLRSSSLALQGVEVEVRDFPQIVGEAAAGDFVCRREDARGRDSGPADGRARGDGVRCTERRDATEPACPVRPLGVTSDALVVAAFPSVARIGSEPTS